MSARVVQLDVLRAVAIVLVLFHHPVNRWTGPAPWLPEALHAVGYSGVDLFFVLSGYLVSGLLLRDWQRLGHLRVRRFLVRRALKIWPAYYAYLAFVALLVWRTGADPSDLVALLLQVQSYVPLSYATHTWSLAVEEHFYLLLPPTLALLLRRGGAWLPAVTAGLLGFGLVARWAADTPLPALQTHLRLDTLFVGVTLAWVQHLHPERFARWTRPALPALAIGALLVPLAHLPWPGVDPALQRATVPTVLALAYALVLLGALGLDRYPLAQRLLASAPARGVAFLGEHSYSVYLWHADLGRTLVQIGALLLGVGTLDVSTAGWALTTVVYAAVSFGVGVLLSRGIEQPALALRDRLFGE